MRRRVLVILAGALLFAVTAKAQTVTATLATGTSASAVAVNPVTNKIYAADDYSNNVTVIDGATMSTVTVAVGSSPRAVAVNPVTNKIYVANNYSYDVQYCSRIRSKMLSLVNGELQARARGDLPRIWRGLALRYVRK